MDIKQLNVALGGVFSIPRSRRPVRDLIGPRDRTARSARSTCYLAAFRVNCRIGCLLAVQSLSD
jgi:hypothetical protein